MQLEGVLKQCLQVGLRDLPSLQDDLLRPRLQVLLVLGLQLVDEIQHLVRVLVERFRHHLVLFLR